MQEREEGDNQYGFFHPSGGAGRTGKNRSVVLSR